MIIVSNSTPLIGFASIQRFDLLKRLFGELYIPQAVYDEVVVAGGDACGVHEVRNATWIKTIGVKDRLAAEGLLPIIRPDIERLDQKGFSLSQFVINAVLQEANE